MSFSERRQEARHEMAEIRRALDPERAVMVRVIQLMELLMSKQLDDLTSAVGALKTAVDSLVAKAATPGVDESAALEAVATQIQGIVTQINAALAPSPPAGP